MKTLTQTHQDCQTPGNLKYPFKLTSRSLFSSNSSPKNPQIQMTSHFFLEIKAYKESYFLVLLISFQICTSTDTETGWIYNYSPNI